MGVPNVKKEFTHYPKCLKCNKVAKLEFINNSIDHINVYCEDAHTGTISLHEFCNNLMLNNHFIKTNVKDLNTRMFCKRCMRYLIPEQYENNYLKGEHYKHELATAFLLPEEITYINDELQKANKEIDNKTHIKNTFNDLITLFNYITTNSTNDSSYPNRFYYEYTLELEQLIKGLPPEVYKIIAIDSGSLVACSNEEVLIFKYGNNKQYYFDKTIET